MEHDRSGHGDDVTGRTDALLREAFETLDCGYSLYDEHRRLIAYNRNFWQLHEATFKELGQPDYPPAPRSAAANNAAAPVFYEDLMLALIRRSLPGATAQEIQAELLRRVEMYEASGENQDFERRYPDSRWKRVARRRLSGGQIMAVALDITDLKEREMAIAASEAKHRALLDTSPVGIWHLDEDGQTLFGNARLAALFGGEIPPSLLAAPLHRLEAQAGEGPFGFPPGQEAEASILASGSRRRTHVLVCASGWFDHGLHGARGAVLTLLDITPLKAAQTRAEHLAWHDALTGLANRAQFRYALGAALSGEGQVTLMLVDLDRFKEANDRYGHAAGDAVLCEVALRLRTAASPDDLVCRLGGDEFAILLRGPEAAGRAAAVAPMLVASLAGSARAAGRDIGMSASIGFASWPRDAPDAEALQRSADLALYAAKNTGRSRAVRFEPALLEARERSTRISAELGRAIPGGGLRLLWQPQVRVPGLHMRSAEALVRWPNSPFEGREATPDEFLPLALEAGLMTALDGWVMDAALRQARDWVGQPNAPEKIAVNISAGALTDRTLPARVAAALRLYGLPAAVLEVEVPESLAARDLDEVAPVLTEMAEMGIGLALDDFGGGLSSLSHLVRLPVNLLKLDRSIVAGLPGDRERTLLRAVMSLAGGLSIPVLAEGIETEAQAFALRREGCTLMQGFLFGRPVPADILVPPRFAA